VIPSRFATELCYQLECAEQLERLAGALASGPIFLTLWQEGQSEVLTSWKSLADKGLSPAQFYIPSLERLREVRSRMLPLALRNFGQLFEYRAEFKIALELAKEYYAVATDNADERHLISSEIQMGWILLKFKEHEVALEYFQKALARSEGSGNGRGIASALGNIASVHLDQGRYDETLELSRQQLAIGEAIGVVELQIVAIGRIGLVFKSRAQYTEALEYYRRQLALCTTSGDKWLQAMAIGNTANVYMAQGLSPQAIEWFERHLKLCEELGDIAGISRTTGNMGILYMNDGLYEKAKEAFQTQRVMCEELSDPFGLCRAIGALGSYYLSTGDLLNALRLLADALERSRILKYQYATVYWLESLSQTLLALAEANNRPDEIAAILNEASTERAVLLRVARRFAEECLALSVQLKKSDTFLGATIDLARVNALEGFVELAVNELEKLLQSKSASSESSEASYWLWKISPTEEHRRAAEALYTEMLDSRSHFDSQKRLQELQQAAVADA
jgi:tetratricopeptide (TPR) repeat protein